MRILYGKKMTALFVSSLRAKTLEKLIIQVETIIQNHVANKRWQ